MDKIYGVYGTSKSRNYNPNQRESNQRYTGSRQTYNAIKARGLDSIDSLEYKRMLDTIEEGKEAVRNVDKFKSLINRANEKITSKLTVAPLKDDSYDYETRKMMENGGFATKTKIERTTELEQLSKKTKADSYKSTCGKYKRDLGYDTKRIYDSYENDSNSNGKTPYNNSTNAQNYNPKKQENIDNIGLLEKPKKESFWSKFKKAVKEFFKSEPKEEITENISMHANRSNKFRQNVPKAAPQIDKDAVERRRLENIRAEAIKSR